MWLLISTRLRRWLVAAVAVPMLTFLLRAVRQRLEARSGQSAVSRALLRLEHLGATLGRRGRRGRSDPARYPTKTRAS